MDKVYRTLKNKEKIQVFDYIKDYLKLYPETKILVGTDSQNRRDKTIYATVIGLYRPGKGAHVIYNKEIVPRERDMVSRLLNEVWRSVEISESILKEIGSKVSRIDIDINPDPKYKSNIALSSAVGMVIGMGYEVHDKGNSPLMTYASDMLCKA